MTGPCFAGLPYGCFHIRYGGMPDSHLYKAGEKMCPGARSVYALLIFLRILHGSNFKIRGMSLGLQQAKLNIKGVIRLDYAPVWFMTGLLFERILVRRQK